MVQNLTTLLTSCLNYLPHAHFAITTLTSLLFLNLSPSSSLSVFAIIVSTVIIFLTGILPPDGFTCFRSLFRCYLFRYAFSNLLYKTLLLFTAFLVFNFFVDFYISQLEINYPFISFLNYLPSALQFKFHDSWSCFSSCLYFQSLEQSFTHSKYSINIY